MGFASGLRFARRSAFFFAAFAYVYFLRSKGVQDHASGPWMQRYLGILNWTLDDSKARAYRQRLQAFGRALTRAGSPPVCAANTDSFRSMAVLWQAGQAGVSLARTSASK